MVCGGAFPQLSPVVASQIIEVQCQNQKLTLAQYHQIGYESYLQFISFYLNSFASVCLCGSMSYTSCTPCADLHNHCHIECD